MAGSFGSLGNALNTILGMVPLLYSCIRVWGAWREVAFLNRVSLIEKATFAQRLEGGGRMKITR